MGAFTSLQTLLTITGDTASGDVTDIQPMEGWLDMLNYADAIVTIQTKTISLAAGDTADIMLATTDQKRAGTFAQLPNGPIWNAWTQAAVTSNQWYKQLLSLEDATVTAATKPVDRWLCWALTVHNGGTGGNFSATFAITVTAKTPA